MMQTKNDIYNNIIHKVNPNCPHCGKKMLVWECPPIAFDDGLGWGTPYLYVCFNDECSLYKNGWANIKDNFNVNASYRCICDPTNTNHNMDCMLVYSSLGGRNYIVDDKNTESENLIRDIVIESNKIRTNFFEENSNKIIELANRIYLQFMFNHGKILLFGNGGSAADAQHIAAEFVNRFESERQPLAAIALTTDTSVITSIANDYSYDEIFSKQIQAIGQRLDIAIGISTSGNSENVYRGLSVAQERGLHTVGFLGKDGGKIKDLCQTSFIVKSDNTARIQETHITLGHIICKCVEDLIYCEVREEM